MTLVMQEQETKFVSAAAKEWRELKSGREWKSWMKVGAALEIISHYALREAGTNDRQSPVYKKCFSSALKDMGFGDMDAQTRSYLVYLAEPENRVIADELRAQMPPKEQQRINHPASMAKRVREHIRQRDGLTRHAAKPDQAETRIASLEELLGRIDASPQEIAVKWWSEQPVDHIARVLAGADANKAAKLVEALKTQLADDDAFRAL